MMALFAGHLVISLQSGKTIENVAVHDTLRPALVTVALLALLLGMDEVGLGGAAAAFGGLVVLGYVLAAGGELGPAASGLVSQYLSTGGANT